MGAGNHASYDFSHIGENIAALRRASGMTQEMLAFRLGVSSQAVSKWEKGATLPNAKQFLALCEILEIDDVRGESSPSPTCPCFRSSPRCSG